MNVETFLSRVEDLCDRTESCEHLYETRLEITLCSGAGVLPLTLRPGSKICFLALQSKDDRPGSIGTSYCPELHPGLERHEYQTYCTRNKTA